MADRPEARSDLADVLQAQLAGASPELFGTVPPAVAITVSGQSLAFGRGSFAERTGMPGPTQTLAGTGETTLSLSGTVARVRRARDLALALLTTDVDRVVAAARSTVQEAGYTTTNRLTELAVTAVETQLAGDAATARISLYLEAEIELSRPPRDGEEVPTSPARGRAG